jgi:signal transduction histidine kinase
LTALLHPSVPFDELAQAIYNPARDAAGAGPERHVPQRCFLDCSRVNAERDLRGVPPACYPGCPGWSAVSEAIALIRKELPFDVFKSYLVELYLATGRDVAEAMFVRLYDPQMEPRFPTASTSRLVLPTAVESPTAPGLLFRLCQFNRWLITIRFVVAALVAGLALLAVLVLRLDFSLVALLSGAGAVFVINLVHSRRFRGHRDLRMRYQESCAICTEDFLQTQILGDFSVLAVLLFFTGGMLSPITLVFFPHLILAALLLPRRKGLITTGVAILLYAAVILLQLAELTPPNSLTRLMTELTSQPLAYPVFLLGFAGFAAALHHFTLQVGEELRTWQTEVFAMNALAQERNTIVSRLNERLVRVDTIRQRMVRVASHDLKSPLAAVEATVKVVLGGYAGPLGDKQVSLLQNCVTRLGAMREFINEILDVATLEKEGLRRELTVVNASPLVQQVQGNAEFAAAEKHIGLVFRSPEQPVYLHASPRRFVQVLQNLVDNALKFTPGGGSVNVAIEPREKDVLFSVSDTGPGISPDELKNVFDEFYRVKAARQAGIGGSGLGLYIVKSIVSAHDGVVWAESALGQGSTFRFTIPRAPAPEKPTASDDPEPQPAETPQKTHP